MARCIKQPEERKLEIIQDMAVAKGTFYYYFKSKAEVLKAIAYATLDRIVGMGEPSRMPQIRVPL